MQGSFEKRVQEKLEELKLTPSDPVWKAIEKEIRPERRRRFPLWIPFVVVLLAGTGWWLLSNQEQASAVDVATVPVTALPAQKEADRNANKTSANGEATNRKSQPAVPSATVGGQDYDPTRFAETKPFSGTMPRVAKTEYQNRTGFIPFSKNNTPADERTVSSSQPADKKGKTTADANPPGNHAEKTGLTVAVTETSPDLQPTTNHTEQTKSATADTAALKTPETLVEERTKPVDSVASKKKLAVVKTGWRKMLTLEGGWSRPTTGGLFAGGSTPDLYASPSTGASNGVTYGYRSPMTTGPAFRAGAGLSKTWGRRWEFSAGLTYAYYSNRSRVGDFRTLDTAFASFSGAVAVGGYYRNTSQQDYTTRYHVLEVPVSVGFRPFLRLPLTLSVGASYGRLLHTNALSFHPWMNIYYKDAQAIQKNFFAGFSSLQFTVLNRRVWRLDVGPLVQYHFSPIRKDSSSSQHISFTGLKTTFHF